MLADGVAAVPGIHDYDGRTDVVAQLVVLQAAPAAIRDVGAPEPLT
jgi:hypothetical protein